MKITSLPKLEFDLYRPSIYILRALPKKVKMAKLKESVPPIIIL